MGQKNQLLREHKKPSLNRHEKKHNGEGSGVLLEDIIHK